MKKIIISLLAVMFCFSVTAIAEEAAKSGSSNVGAATKEECIQKVNEAVEMVRKDGIEKTMSAVNDPKGKFVWKDSYVFSCNTETGLVLAQPSKPALIGKNLTGLKDVNGKMFFVEFADLAKTGKPGWVEYMWPKMDEKIPSKKITYVCPVPELNIYFGAGVYE